MHVAKSLITLVMHVAKSLITHNVMSMIPWAKLGGGVVFWNIQPQPPLPLHSSLLCPSYYICWIRNCLLYLSKWDTSQSCWHDFNMLTTLIYRTIKSIHLSFTIRSLDFDFRFSCCHSVIFNQNSSKCFPIQNQNTTLLQNICILLDISNDVGGWIDQYNLLV